MRLFLILFFALVIGFCYKFGDWRNWEKYQATILFLIAGDLLHRCVTAQKQLWYYQTPLISGFILNLLIMLIVYPSTILIFIPMLKGPFIWKTGVYAVWVLIYTLLEKIGSLAGVIKYSNGWHGWLSIIFDAMLFALVWLHYKKPFWAYISAIAITIFMITAFKIPLMPT